MNKIPFTFPSSEVITLSGGQSLIVHSKSVCKGEVCAIHNPSDHSMKDWPQEWTTERGGYMRRISPDGTRVPDPDCTYAKIIFASTKPKTLMLSQVPEGKHFRFEGKRYIKLKAKFARDIVIVQGFKLADSEGNESCFMTCNSMSYDGMAIILPTRAEVELVATPN